MNIALINEVKERLSIGHRISNRNLLTFRDISIEDNLGDNGLIVNLGHTRIFAHIIQSTFIPSKERPNEGQFKININYNNINIDDVDSSIKLDINEIINLLTLLLTELLKGSKAIDQENLCLLRGVKAYSILCYLNILEDDGNLLDACSFAIIAILLQHKKYNSFDSGTLPLLHYPMFVTFAIILDSNEKIHIISDPDAYEVLAQYNSISVGCNSAGDVCNIYNSGGIGFGDDILETVVSLAHERVKYLEKFFIK